ncbi:MAG: hypothetical protein ACFFD1_13090, partial [Candidatus Thorarchaeota archaeon]
MQRCKQCGVNSNETALFCSNCGLSFQVGQKADFSLNKDLNKNQNSFVITKSVRFPTYIKQFGIVDTNYQEVYFSTNDISFFPKLFTILFTFGSILILLPLLFFFPLLIPALIILFVIYNIILFFLKILFNFYDFKFYKIDQENSGKVLIAKLRKKTSNHWQILDEKNIELFSVSMKGSGLSKEIIISGRSNEYKLSNEDVIDNNTLKFRDVFGGKQFTISKTRKRSVFISVDNPDLIDQRDIFFLGVLFDLKYWNSSLVVSTNDENRNFLQKKLG